MQSQNTETKISAQQLIQNNSDANDITSDFNSEFYNQLNKLNYDTYHILGLIDSNSTKQRINSSIFKQICEFKRFAELSVLNSIHRFVLKLKFNLIYQIIDQYSANTKNEIIRTIMDSSFENENDDDRIKLQLIKLVQLNETFNDDLLDDTNLYQLNYFVQKQLNLITCKCFDLSDKVSDLDELDDLVDLRNFSNDLIVNLKNFKRLDSLNSRRLFIQRALSNNLNSTIDILTQNVLNNAKLSKESNSANYRTNANIKNKLNDLDNLEINLLEQIRLKGELSCKLGCDNLEEEEDSSTKLKIDQSLCTLINLLFNQTDQIFEPNSFDEFDNQIDNQLVNKVKQFRFKRNSASSSNQTYESNQENENLPANGYEICQEVIYFLNLVFNCFYKYEQPNRLFIFLFFFRNGPIRL